MLGAIGYEEDCRRFVQQMAKNRPRFNCLFDCNTFRAITQAMTEYTLNPAWERYLQDIDAFIPPRMLEEHAKTLFEDQYLKNWLKENNWH